MTQQNKTEVWLRGPVAGIPGLLQPVAHALLQAREEVQRIMTNFPDANLWQKPAGVASIGFHLQHLTGVLDRLFTYARGEQLSDQQLDYLANEGKAVAGRSSVAELVHLFEVQVDQAITQLGATDEQMLTAPRLVGRRAIPSTMLGLLFHSAEHAMRHVGQLYVTIKVISDRVRTGL
jgi:uncharacterized damage-inducible protein DinB